MGWKDPKKKPTEGGGRNDPEKLMKMGLLFWEGPSTGDNGRGRMKGGGRMEGGSE